MRNSESVTKNIPIAGTVGGTEDAKPSSPAAQRRPLLRSFQGRSLQNFLLPKHLDNLFNSEFECFLLPRCHTLFWVLNLQL